MKTETQIILPELGEGIDKAVVACWHAQPGDAVCQEDDLLEVVTDKATFHIPASVDGVLKTILVPAGQEARIGEPLAVIDPI